MRSSIDQSRDGQIDGTDRVILGLLRENPRVSFAVAGRLTGLSLSATRQRVHRLTALGVVRFGLLLDPFALDVGIVCGLAFRVTGSVAPLAALLSTMTGVTYAAETTGSYAAEAELLCDDEQQLQERLAILHSVPGVQDIRLEEYTAILKDTGSW